MFPAPTTIAISTPVRLHLGDLLARSRRSRPGPCRSPGRPSAPRRRASAGRAGTTGSAGRGAALGSAAAHRHSASGEAPELEHLEPVVVERLRHRLARVVDPGLLLEHDLRRRTTSGASPRRSSRAPARASPAPRRSSRRSRARRRRSASGTSFASRRAAPTNDDVHREPARRAGVAAAHVHEHADLVRRRVHVVGERLAVAGLEARGADDDDVLAELADELRRARPRAASTALGAVAPRRPRGAFSRRPGTPRCSRRARSRSRRRPSCPVVAARR